jgi:hypothetical protein
MSIRDDSNQEWHFDEYKKTALIERPLPSIYTNNENIPVATLIEQADLNVIYDHLIIKHAKTLFTLRQSIPAITDALIWPKR